MKDKAGDIVDIYEDVLPGMSFIQESLKKF